MVAVAQGSGAEFKKFAQLHCKERIFILSVDETEAKGFTFSYSPDRYPKILAENSLGLATRSQTTLKRL